MEDSIQESNDHQGDHFGMRDDRIHLFTFLTIILLLLNFQYGFLFVIDNTQLGRGAIQTEFFSSKRINNNEYSLQKYHYMKFYKQKSHTLTSYRYKVSIYLVVQLASNKIWIQIEVTGIINSRELFQAIQ